MAQAYMKRPGQRDIFSMLRTSASREERRVCAGCQMRHINYTPNNPVYLAGEQPLSPIAYYASVTRESWRRSGRFGVRRTPRPSWRAARAQRVVLSVCNGYDRQTEKVRPIAISATFPQENIWEYGNCRQI